MPYAEQYYKWSWDLAATPEALWPLVSDTDRFNRDCGYPAVTVVPDGEIKGPRAPGTRRLRTRHLGLTIEWDERPFEWVMLRRFGVERLFHRGPFSCIRAGCELIPRPAGGTTLTYEIWFTPANFLGRLALQAGGAAWQFGWPMRRVFAEYDRLALAGAATSNLARHARLSPGGAVRLAAVREALVAEAGQPADLVDRLADFIATTDDLSGQRIRAYALADHWGRDRREVLRLVLHATHAGLLDFSWDIICPHCRGAKAVTSSLYTLRPQARCDTCQIDFVADFDQSVEITFAPNAAIRDLPRTEYCVGGPQITPHIVVQQLLLPAERRSFKLALRPGRYRLRSPLAEKPHRFRIEAGAATAGTMPLAPGPETPDEAVLAPDAELAVSNPSDSAQLAIIEHVAWSDQATMATEVTSLQLFRDLFSREVLRPGEKITVGRVTIVFTDLKGSTQLYREIGDAPAFSRVLTHFDILKAAVDAEGGAIVKTMGDAIMAVFPRPLPALRALLVAQRQLILAQSAIPWKAGPGGAALSGPLTLKAGIHHGPCIAINQNARLDYFGTTVNVAARLCGLSTGTDLVISAAVGRDPEIALLLDSGAGGIQAAVELTPLRGFANETFEVLRVARVSRPAENHGS